MRGGAGFGSNARSQAEVAGIEQGPMAFMGQQALGRTEHVSSRMECHRRTGAERLRLPERQDMFDSGSRHARTQETGCRGGADNLPMGGNVVGMRVRNERAVNCHAGIEIPTGLWQPESAPVLNIPWHAR